MWQLRLGITQVAILVGVICGSLVCAFAVGYISGQKIGFENALNNSVAALPRHPIENSAVNEPEPQPEQVKEVYANLESMPVLEPTEESTQADEELPKLGTVKEVTTSPLVDDLVVDLLDEETEHKEAELLGDTQPAVAEVGATVKDTTSADAKVEGAVQALTDELLADVTKTNEATPVAKLDLKNTKQEEQQVPSASPVPSVAPVEEKSGFLKLKVQPGWYVQLSAAESLSEANGLAQKLKDSGFPVTIEKAVVRNQNYYRVLVGPEDNSDLGGRLLQQVKREKYITGAPFLRMAR